MRATGALSGLPNSPDGAAPPVGRLLLLIQVLVGYGKELADTLRQQHVTPHFRLTLLARFGTTDFAHILIRIGRALRLAAALEARLGSSPPPARTSRPTPNWRWSRRACAATGQPPPPIGAQRRVGPMATTSRMTTCPVRKRSSPWPAAAKIGAVIEAICRDLGLVPSVVTEQQWSELADIIRLFGGNFVGLIGDAVNRIHTYALNASFTRPLTKEAIGHLHNAIFARPAPA